MALQHLKIHPQLIIFIREARYQAHRPHSDTLKPNLAIRIQVWVMPKSMALVSSHLLQMKIQVNLLRNGYKEYLIWVEMLSDIDKFRKFRIFDKSVEDIKRINFLQRCPNDQIAWFFITYFHWLWLLLTELHINLNLFLTSQSHCLYKKVISNLQIIKF